MRFIAILALLFTIAVPGYAQYCTTPSSTTAITPSSTPQTTASYPAGTAPVFTFTATAGCTYTFTTCGLSSVDTYLRIYNSTTTLVQGWDDQCGLQTNAVWTAPSSGAYSIQLSQYVCGPLLGAASMTYSVSCPTPPCINPVVNAGNDITVCAGAPGQLNGTVSAGTGSGGTGTVMTVTISSGGWLDMVGWSLTNATGTIIGSGGPYALASTNTVTIANPGAGPYSFYLETQGTICDNNPNYNITCNGTSVLSGTLGPCTSTTISVASCTGTPSTAPITYVWTPATNLSSTTILNPTATPTTTTTYTLTATQGTCTSQDQVTVFVTPLPTVDAGPDITSCGGSVNLNGSATSTGGFSGPITINVLSGSNLDETSWTLTNSAGTIIGSGGPYATGSNNTVTIPAPTSPPYTFAIETQGASNSNVAGYNILCGTTSLIGGMTIITGGQTASVGVTGCAGNISPTVSWSPSATLSNPSILNPVATPTTTTTYTLTATANGCSNQDQMTVTIGSAATVNVNSPTICSGQSTTLTATSPTPGGTFTWSPGGQTGSSITVNPSVTSTYQVSYTLNGCTGAPATATVTVNPGPTVSGSTMNFCPGSPVTLTASGSPSGGTYLWTPTNQTTNSITVTPTATTSYNVQYSLPGCGTATSTITANQINSIDWANIQWPGTSAICEGQSLDIYGQVYEANVTNPAGQATGISVAYAVSSTNSNPATWPASAWIPATYNPFASTNPNNDEYMATLTGLTAGTYYYAFSYTYNGCTVYGGYNPGGGGFWDGINNVNGVVTVSAIVAPAFTQIAPICAGSVLAPLPTTSNNGIAGTWSPAPNNTQTTAYTFTPAVGTCATTASMTISVNALPTVNITNNPATTELNCNQTSIMLSGSGGGTYSWSNGVAIVGTNQNFNVSNPGDYTLTVTNSNGCQESQTVQITQDTISPIVSIGSSTTQLNCNTTSISLNGSGATTYNWYNGTTNLGSSNPLVVSAPGTYTLVGYEPNGCSSTISELITQDITVPPVQIINNTGATVLTCSLTNISLTATGGGTYSWSNGSTVLATAANVNISAPGTYTVTVTGANGCTATANITISQDIILPTVAISNSTNTNQLNCTVTNISLQASGGTSYTWSNGTSIVSNAAQYNTSTPGTYTVTGYAANGCTNTATYTITQDLSVPTSSISSSVSGNTLTCTTTSISLTGSGNGSFAWIQGSNNIGTAATISINTPGTYNLIVTAANGCTAISSVNITQNTTPPITNITNITGTTVLTCTTTSIDLVATGGTTYSWSNGSTVVGTNAALNVTAPGIYTVTVTGANGCAATASVTITQNTAAPTVTISNTTGGAVLNCTTTSINLQASGGVSYSWSNGTTTVGSNASLSVTSPGTYTVTATGANGCTATANTTITQTIAAPIPGITNTSNSTELNCTLTSIALAATGGGTYSWSNGTSVVGTNANLNVSAPGTYTVTVTGSNGCTATSSSTITQNVTSPTAAISSNLNTTMLSCTNNSLVLTANGGVGYAWSNGSTSLGNNASITISTPGTYNVIVTGTNGCTSTASSTITQNNQAPIVSINPTFNGVLTCTNPTLTLAGSSSTGSGTATWLNGSAVISTGPIAGPGNVANLVVNTPGTYTLNITEANGCQGTANYVVTQNITVPTAAITNNSNATVLTCTQTTISLTASGANTYSWSNGTSTVGTNAAVSVSTPGTYTVTATGTNGCQDTEVLTITQNTTAPIAGITNNTSATQLTCSLTSISLTATGGGTYSWSNGTAVVSTNSNLTVTSPGTYTVTVTSATNGCTATSAVIITQNTTAPSAAISAVPNTAVLTCATTSIALTASGGGTYAWVSGSTNLGSNSSINVTTPGTYTVTVTGSNGCTATASSVITQNISAPTAAITSVPNTTILTCSTTSISLTANGGISYSWSNGSTVVGTNATLAVTLPGTYTVTVTGANGCTATASNTITQNITTPVAGIFNASNTNILTCTQTNINVNANGGLTYTWSNGTTNVGNAAALTITSPGTYTVTATAANGCTDTEVITITQNIVPPTASITNVTATTILDCNTAAITLNASGGVSYSWANGATNLGTNTSITVNSAGTYVLTATAANGCTDTESITITSQANTNPTFNPIAAICTGGTINLPSSSTNGVNGTWNPAINNLATTTYTFTPAVGVCANTATLSVTVNPYPTISASNDTICNGSNGTITTQINLVGGTYTWLNNSNTQANLISSPNTTTNYTVIYNLAGCTDTATAQIVVNPVPVVQVQNATICEGQTGMLVASSNLPNGQFTWANGSSNDTISLSPLSTVTQNVTYTLNGCTSLPVTATLTVNPVPTITMNNQTICAGDPVTMQAVANPAGIYYWGPNAVQGISSNTFLPTQDSTLQVFNILNGCSSDTIQASVAVTPLPISTFSANILQGCVPLSVDFVADVANNASYAWQTSNQLTANGANANLNFQTAGNFTVTLTTTLNGCSSTTTINNMIAVDNYPIASFEPSSQVFTEPNQSISFWNSSVGASSYTWEFGDGGSSNEVGPTHIFNSDEEGATIVLYAFSNLGCADTTSFFIGFDPGLVYYIPNAFTPDGDQFNQTFRPIFTSGIDPYNYQMLIYNRWGEVIFETQNPDFGWDGSYTNQGNPCQIGTYTYVITVKLPNVDKRQTIRGHVNLIR